MKNIDNEIDDRVPQKVEDELKPSERLQHDASEPEVSKPKRKMKNARSAKKSKKSKYEISSSESEESFTEDSSDSSDASSRDSDFND